MDKSELIWMNGELVPWEDAKVHVLTHGLHYGTGVFEGIRAYETERGTAVFRHREHLERLAALGRALLHGAAVLASSELREATHELIRRNGLAQLLHPPDRLPRLRRDGPVRAERAGRRRRSPSGRGAPTSARRASAAASACKVSSWRRISPDSLIPQAKASGQYLNSILAKTESAQGGLRRGDPARRPGQRLRGLGRERLHRPRRRALDAGPHRLDPRRHHPPVGDPDRDRPRLPGRASATSRAASSTWPTRCS